jgi:hypothetical protein
MADVKGVNASHKRTGYDHGVSILMMNHGVAAVTLLCYRLSPNNLKE